MTAWGKACNACNAKSFRVTQTFVTKKDFEISMLGEILGGCNGVTRILERAGWRFRTPSSTPKNESP